MFRGHLANPFDSLRFSHANFNTFAERHIALLGSFNGSAELLAATTPIVESYKLLLTDMSSHEGRKQAKTVSVNELVKEIKKYISRKGGVVADAFPATSPTYQEFYPHGRAEYTLAAKKNIQVLVERFRDACLNHQTELGTDIGTKMTDFAQRLANTRKLQIDNVGNVKDKSSVLDGVRKQLAKQMYINLLTLTLKNVDNTEYVRNYYDTSMLKHGNKKNGAEPETPQAPQA